MEEKTKVKPPSMRQLRANCRRFLSGNYPQTARSWLESLLVSPQIDLPLDAYGEGPAVQQLEQEVATLLGKEAALFMPKGVIAQQAALRVWADRRKTNNIVLHPKSHIEFDENGAYQRLAGLVGIQIGVDHQPFDLAQLQTIREPLGAVVVELPLRQAGYKLLAWDELVKLSEWTRGQGIPLHFDGARLWETGPYYGRSYAEIAGLADSVYVSFYKGLGGMAGCVLAGPADFIEETKVWKARYGGNLYTAFPYVLSALEGLHHHLPKMPEYYERAKQFAVALAELPNLTIAPNPPQTNSFQLYLPGDRDKLQQAIIKLTQEDKLWLFGVPDETAVPGLLMTEIVIGEASEGLTPREAAEGVQRLLEMSK